ncbi:hypothetical protein HNY73_019196 [Argiope bruennichi]|uniref:Uncharacterized protein n=1 Tax=Argiope bruennichi TaxID=94029 RepID=A0A8T0EFN3_ARGBR|nr:hypothetical protein HNY73_019196 [Argiope bruennichi]
MLQNGIPSSFVLDKVQQEYSPTKRYGLTNRKDIHNIRRDFRIEKKIAHKEDAISVDIILQKMIADDYNPIFVYKPIGETLFDFPQIGAEEFLLGFATEAQMKLLELYGEKCIMLDSTHGTNQYGFQLTTVLVNNTDNHEVNFSTKTDAASICSNADDVNEGEFAIAVNEHKELQSFEKSAIVNQLQRKSRTDISAQKAC